MEFIGWAIGTFYILNPQMWPPGVIRGAQMMMDVRMELVSKQQQGHRDHALASIRQRVGTGARMLFVFAALPLGWSRYYHKYLPLQALLVAIGLGFFD